jgi:hypothetical protein
MCEHLEDILDAMRRVGTLDASGMPGDQAARLVEEFAELERLAVAGRTLAVARAADTGAWYGSGASSPAVWLAARTGGTLHQAAETLQTARRLPERAATREMLIKGQLSERQAAEITQAAAADPSAEASLLELAQHEGLAALRERCRDVAAAAQGDEDATERIRRSRYLRHWSDRDGATRLDARLAPDDAAPLLAAVAARAQRLSEEARRAGQHEPDQAHAADALVSLVDGAGAPRAVVHVHVSDTALRRGHTTPGETCRISGVGPISVSAARRLAAGGVVKVLELDGMDVRRVAHAGRMIPAHLRSALQARDPVCVVPGCNRRRGLEIDHVVPLASGGRTELGNLVRLCRWHHSQKTHHGWRLEGVPGRWGWARTCRGP